MFGSPRRGSAPEPWGKSGAGLWANSSASKLPFHPLCRVMARSADHRARRVASGSAIVQTLEGTLVRNALIESESIVDVMNVPPADAEMPLDSGGAQGEDLLDQVAGAGSEQIANREQVLHVARLFVFPAGAPKLIGDPLHEQRGAVAALGIL